MMILYEFSINQNPSKCSHSHSHTVSMDLNPSFIYQHFNCRNFSLFCLKDTYKHILTLETLVTPYS